MCVWGGEPHRRSTPDPHHLPSPAPDITWDTRTQCFTPQQQQQHHHHPHRPAAGIPALAVLLSQKKRAVLSTTRPESSVRNGPSREEARAPFAARIYCADTACNLESTPPWMTACRARRTPTLRTSWLKPRPWCYPTTPPRRARPARRPRPPTAPQPCPRLRPAPREGPRSARLDRGLRRRRLALPSSLPHHHPPLMIHPSDSQ
ncbi:unnamed protein product [Ectocarpus fasciculatus]